jgi:hypothetical protein
MVEGWEVDGAYVRFPIASLPGLSAASADGLSGDARQVAASFLSGVFRWYNGLASKPTAFVPRYTPGTVVNYGTLNGSVRAEFRIAVHTDYPENTVTAE